MLPVGANQAIRDVFWWSVWYSKHSCRRLLVECQTCQTRCLLDVCGPDTRHQTRPSDLLYVLHVFRRLVELCCLYDSKVKPGTLRHSSFTSSHVPLCLDDEPAAASQPITARLSDLASHPVPLHAPALPFCWAPHSHTTLHKQQCHSSISRWLAGKVKTALKGRWLFRWKHMDVG